MANLKARSIKIGENIINIGYSEHDLTDELFNKLNGIENWISLMENKTLD